MTFKEFVIGCYDKFGFYDSSRCCCYDCGKALLLYDKCQPISIWGYQNKINSPGHPYHLHKLNAGCCNYFPVCDDCNQSAWGKYQIKEKQKKDYDKEYRKKYQKKIKENLSDGYIKARLVGEGVPKQKINEYPEIIEIRRLIIKTKRNLKNFKNDYISNKLS